MERRSAKEILDSLKKDLITYNDAIKEVAEEIVRENFSKYPVFIAHQHEVALGEVILNKDELGTEWTINASTMEELEEKGVIKPDRTDDFMENYKSPKKFMCIFLITELGGNFVFMPFKSEK